MPELKIEEDVSPARASKARAPAETAVVKARAQNGAEPDWRGICAVCLDPFPVECAKLRFYPCCCRKICAVCADRCLWYDPRCPLCKTAACTSFEWLRRVVSHVSKGDAEAQYQLANVYRDGDMGLEACPERAFKLVERAAKKGHVRAMALLGSCHERGSGVPIDYAAAAKWYRIAAERGHPGAQFNLGHLYSDGNGVLQSFCEAVRWYHAAAAQNNANAMHNLGMLYGNGFGVEMDLRAAKQFFKRAAALGHANAVMIVSQLAEQRLIQGPDY